MKVASAMLACCLWSCTEPLPTPDHDCYSDSACEQGQYCNLASLQCEDRDNIDGSFGVDISRGQMTQDTAVTNLSDQQAPKLRGYDTGSRHERSGFGSWRQDASLIADQLMPNADGALFLINKIQPDAMQPRLRISWLIQASRTMTRLGTFMAVPLVCKQNNSRACSHFGLIDARGLNNVSRDCAPTAGIDSLDGV